MHVSANIIRFPELPVTPAGAISPEAQASAEIVVFPPPAAEERLDADAQQHGQIFAAHRLVGRIAHQLDQIAML